MKVLQLYIELEDSSPKIWRRIIVPADYTFYQLHMALQAAFGWSNIHLFQFSENDLYDKLTYGLPDSMYDGEDFVVKDARKFKIIKVFRSIGFKYLYIYDMGDCWEHRITLEEIKEDDISRPVFLDGAGACPPEDCGGINGYEQMLSILSTPGHPEKKSYNTWIGLSKGEKWNALFCSTRDVNARFGLLDSWQLTF